jgi:tetratricopeptide (TPR) repeat protein
LSEACLIVLVLLLSLPSSVFAENNEITFVGYKVCAECHQEEVSQWKTSHHYQAMQHGTKETVLGDFNQSQFKNFGLVSTFFTRIKDKKAQFWVNTDGPDGQLKNFQIKYTFGVYPLQQYLIEFPGGRLQALDIAWDSRPEQEGGQRWFHLHPDEKITPDDVLHWTGQNLNWNYMCAFCHSTNLEKNYQIETDTYNTQWSEINVSCEACHGPASQHLKWAEQETTNNKADDQFPNKGLLNKLSKNMTQWKINPQTKHPFLAESVEHSREIETCARCHSRRSQLGSDKVHLPLMDSFRPARLTPGLYHPDGQVNNEVYVSGSFIQSKMFAAGVTCSDCHNTHTLALKLPGDQVCNQCHVSEIYRSEEHHFHKTEVSCIDCHMPPKTYMGVDVRNDHSFRIPRPDISNKLTGDEPIPNACNQCHTAQTAQWAEQQLKQWYNRKPVGHQRFETALYASQQQAAAAEKQLQALIVDTSQADIARATALASLANFPSAQSYQLIKEQLAHKNPMIRLAALEALVTYDKRTQATLAFPMISDQVRSVRMEAARLLAPIPTGRLPDKDKKQLQRAQNEYLQSQLYNAERPESQVNLGNYYFQKKNYVKAEQAFKQGIKLQGKFVLAHLALAQLLSKTGREPAAQQVLLAAIKNIPDNADLYHSLGLSYTRTGQTDLALSKLQTAADKAPSNRQYQYIYAIALNSYKQTDKALAVLKQLNQTYPDNMEIVLALITINRDAGHYESALEYAYQLRSIEPENADLLHLIEQLKSKLN